MEAYFLATGALHNLKMFETHLQSQAFYLNGQTAQGQYVNQQVFGMLEPLMIYRYVFPKEARHIVLKTLNFDKGHSPLPLPVMWSLRKALNLENAKKEDIGSTELPVLKKDLWVVPLGIKEDPTRYFHENGMTHEAI